MKSRSTWGLALAVSIGLLGSLPPSYCDQVMMQGFPSRMTAPSVTDYNQQIQDNPNSANYKSRAEALRRLGLRKEAIDDLNQSLKLEPADVSSHVLRGQVYFEDGLLDDAITNLNAAIKVDPKFADSYALRARIYLRMKDYSKALADANTVLEYKANSPVGFLLRGAAYNGLKKYSNAIDDCTAAIKGDAKLDKAYYWRAEAYQNTEQYQKSVDDYTQAITLQPDYRPALLGRAWSYYKLDKDAEALKDCNDAIKFHDADDLKALTKYIGEKATTADIVPDPEYNLGEQIEEDLKNSLVIYNDILKDKPGDSDASRDRGIAFMHLAKYRDAVKDFDVANKGLPVNPADFSGLGSQDAYNSAVPDYKQGNQLLTAGNYAGAIDSYQAALQKYPQYGRCWHNLAIACSSLGDYFSAELCCVHAVSYRPDDWKLWHTLGVSLYHEYKRDKSDPTKLNAAAAALKQALDLNPENSADKDDIRKILTSVKNYERALAPVSDFVFTTMPIN